MEGQETTYVKTFIAERQVDGKTEYAFAIREKFLWMSSVNVCSICDWSCDDRSWKYSPMFRNDTSTIARAYHSTPTPVKQAIDNLRKDIEDKHECDMKAYERSKASKWTFKKYP